MQNRKFDGLGPSGNTWPRCASQTLHNTSICIIPHELSFSYRITLSFTGSVKLGQPVPESNFVILSKSWVPQQTQSYTPGANNSQYSPVKARSVACWRVTRNCSGVNKAFHSSSDLVTPVWRPVFLTESQNVIPVHNFLFYDISRFHQCFKRPNLIFIQCLTQQKSKQ